jgi:hypothetical protein
MRGPRGLGPPGGSVTGAAPPLRGVPEDRRSVSRGETSPLLFDVYSGGLAVYKYFMNQEKEQMTIREKRIKEIMAKLEAIQEKCDKCHQRGCFNCPEPRWHLVKELMCLNKFEARKAGKTE